MARIDGLTPPQYTFLAERTATSTDGEAAEKAGVHPSTVSGWLTDGSVFVVLYEQLFRGKLASRRAMFESLEPLAHRAYTAGLTARDRRVSAAQARDWYDRAGVTRGESLEFGVSEELTRLMEKAEEDG